MEEATPAVDTTMMDTTEIADITAEVVDTTMMDTTEVADTTVEVVDTTMMDTTEIADTIVMEEATEVVDTDCTDIKMDVDFYGSNIHFVYDVVSAEACAE